MSAKMPCVHVGYAGWSIPRQYAERFPEQGTHLERYAQRLPAVEINSSFYRPHRPATYARWAALVPEPFTFAIKVPKEITHTRRLRDVAVPLERFLSESSALGTRLGPLLVQLPPSLRFDAAVVEGFFSMLRAHFSGSVVCEPRHASWFTTGTERLLQTAQVARAAADPALVPEAAQPGGWPGLVYYRLHGSPEMYASTYSASYLEKFAQQLHLSIQAVPAWCIFDNTALGAATANALDLCTGLSERGQEQTLLFVLSVGLAGVIHDPKGKLPTLWDALAFTGTGPDAWGEKLNCLFLRQQRGSSQASRLPSSACRCASAGCAESAPQCPIYGALSAGSPSNQRKRASLIDQRW